MLTSTEIFFSWEAPGGHRFRRRSPARERRIL